MLATVRLMMVVLLLACQLLTRIGFAQVKGTSASANRPPNIILILADDLGYGDLGCYGNKEIQTPNLDRLARSGMRWTQFHTASGVCTPTRASIQTGRYPLRFGITKVFADREEHLPAGTVTLPMLLRKAGYTTAHIGKWHLGGLNVKHTVDRQTYPFGPLQMGYDYSLAMYEDPPIRGVMYKGKRIYKDGAKYYMRHDVLAEPSDKHLTDFETDDAIQVIEKSSRENRPFFLNFCPFNPHLPYEPTPEQFINLYKGRATGDELLYRAMVSQLDESVGRIVAKLAELGISDNTLIVFTSDNGPANHGSAGSLSGRKWDLYEGGITVPMIASWSGHIKAGAVSEEFAHTVDLLPTFCEVAGASLPQDVKFDGQSLTPRLMKNQSLPPRGTTFWQMDLMVVDHKQGKKPEPYATEVARNGKWKLMARDGQPVALFNLETDPREQMNVLQQETAMRDKLITELRTWLQEAN